MKIKLGEIVGNIENLKAIQEIKLPIKVSYRIMRLVSKLDPIIKSYEEKKNDLIREHGEEDKDGNISVKDKVKMKAYLEKLTELFKVEEEVGFVPFKIEEFGDVELATKLMINFLFE